MGSFVTVWGACALHQQTSPWYQSQLRDPCKVVLWIAISYSTRSHSTQYRGPKSCTGPEQPFLLKSNCCHTSLSSIRWPRVRPGSDEAHVREERARVAPLRGHAPIPVLLHPAEARQAGLGVQGDIGWRRESRGPTRTQGSRDEHTSALSGKISPTSHPTT